jgi:hypothetical protein
MIRMDYSLIYEARHLATSGNVQRFRTLICCYEQAVYQQANGQPYDSRSERALRDFIQAADPPKTFQQCARDIEWLFRVASIANDGDDPFGRDGVVRSAFRANNDQF